jgi:hypothetical protein
VCAALPPLSPERSEERKRVGRGLERAADRTELAAQRL